MDTYLLLFRLLRSMGYNEEEIVILHICTFLNSSNSMEREKDEQAFEFELMRVRDSNIRFC